MSDVGIELPCYSDNGMSFGTVSRYERVNRAAWIATVILQWAIIGGALAQIGAVWGNLEIPRWMITVDCALVVTYSAGVLTRGRMTLRNGGERI